MSMFTYVRAIQLGRSSTVEELLQAASLLALCEEAVGGAFVVDLHQADMHTRLTNAMVEMRERRENKGHSKTFDSPATTAFVAKNKP